MEGALIALIVPLGPKIDHALLHRDRHADTGQRVFPDTHGRRINEEHDHGVADIFIDGGAMIDGDFGHIGQVIIEDVR